MNRITIYAVDKDSSASYVETLPITKNLKKDVQAFESRIPFSRYYLESETSDIPTDKEYSWMISAELE